ncbi:RNF123, partial [Symbiodinium sp. KB8]
ELSFPSCGSYLRFFKDAAGSGHIQDVNSQSSSTDLVVSGDSLFYNIFDSNRGTTANNSSFNQYMSYAQSQGPASGRTYLTYRFLVYAELDTSQSEAAVRAGGLPCTMQLIGIQLEAEDAIQRIQAAKKGSSADGTGSGAAAESKVQLEEAKSAAGDLDPAKRLPLLLRSLLAALPYAPSGRTAAACMQMGARLFRRWGASGDAGLAKVDAEDEAVRFITEHSVQLPRHVQSLMEMMLAAKKALSALQLPNSLADVPSIAAVTAADLAALGLTEEDLLGGDDEEAEEDKGEAGQASSKRKGGAAAGGSAQAKMLQYLSDREGPQRVSMLALSSGAVLPDFAAVSTTGNSVPSIFASDTVLRGGKWYFEVVFDRVASASHNAYASMGWMTPKFEVKKHKAGVVNSGYQQQQPHVGMDQQGQSWAFNASSHGYYHRQANVPLDQKSLSKKSFDMETAEAVESRVEALRKEVAGAQGKSAKAKASSKKGGEKAGAAADDEAGDASPTDESSEASKMAAMMAAMQASGADAESMSAMMSQLMDMKAGKSGKKDKKSGSSSTNQWSWKHGAIIGCCVDIDKGTFSWVLGGVHHPPAFKGAMIPGKALVPAVSVSSNSGISGVSVNFGRQPFVFPPPEGYLPVEDPARPFSSWLARFEHAADVTRLVHQRLPLPHNVVNMALNEEGCAGDAKALPGEFVSVDMKSSNSSSYPPENLMNDDEHAISYVQIGGQPTHMVFRVAPRTEAETAGDGEEEGDDEEGSKPARPQPKESSGVVISQVQITFGMPYNYGNYPVEGCIFASQHDVTDFGQFQWANRFTDKHFEAFARKKQKEAISAASAAASKEGDEAALAARVADAASAALRNPKTHEPVGFFSKKAQEANCTVQLPVPVNAKYIVVKFMKPNSAGMQASSYYYGGNTNVAVQSIKFMGVLADHPLASVFGSPSFVPKAEELMRDMKAHALSEKAVWTSERDASLVELAQSEATKKGITPADLDAVMLTPSPEDL